MPAKRLVRRVCVRLPDALDAQLVEIARRLDETPSALMRQAIAAAVRYYSRRLAEGGIPQAGPPRDRSL
jgi:predicted transcriptional regulator